MWPRKKKEPNQPNRISARVTTAPLNEGTTTSKQSGKPSSASIVTDASEKKTSEGR